MLSGVEDAPWQPLSLRVLMNEMPSVSRMREIRTSGLRRGEGLTKTVPPLLDRFKIPHCDFLGVDVFTNHLSVMFTEKSHFLDEFT